MEPSASAQTFQDASELASEAYNRVKAGKLVEVSALRKVRHMTNRLKIQDLEYKPVIAKLTWEEGNPPNLWIVGPARTGKSKLAESFVDKKAYHKNNTKWWNGYAGEPHVIISDLDGEAIRYELLLAWADRYPFWAEVKYSSNYIRPERIIVTSNRTIAQTWPKMRKEHVPAIRGRFREVTLEEAQSIVDAANMASFERPSLSFAEVLALDHGYDTSVFDGMYRHYLTSSFEYVDQFRPSSIRMLPAYVNVEYAFDSNLEEATPTLATPVVATPKVETPVVTTPRMAVSKKKVRKVKVEAPVVAIPNLELPVVATTKVEAPVVATSSVAVSKKKKKVTLELSTI